MKKLLLWSGGVSYSNFGRFQYEIPEVISERIHGAILVEKLIKKFSLEFMKYSMKDLLKKKNIEKLMWAF